MSDYYVTKAILQNLIVHMVESGLAKGPTDAAERIVRWLACEYLIDLEEIDEDAESLDDPPIFSDEDRAVPESLETSKELIDRLWAEVETEEATAEMERHRQELDEDDFDDIPDND